jgi:predicted DsbA family dithiol-disulfide isomerase
MAISDLFAGYPMDIDAVLTGMQNTARTFGLPFVKQHRVYNSRLAQELGQWAESQDRGSRFHSATFGAYFAEGKNLGDMTVLQDLAAAVGLDPDQAERVLTQGRYRSAVDADWELARQRGITAVPTLSAADRKLVGAQPYETMVRFIESLGAKKKPLI